MIENALTILTELAPTVVVWVLTFFCAVSLIVWLLSQVRKLVNSLTRMFEAQSRMTREKTELTREENNREVTRGGSRSDSDS